MLRPPIFTRARESPSLTSAAPTGDGGPLTTFFKEGSKIGLKCNKLALITWFIVDGISQNFFCSMPKGSLSSTPFGLCRYLHRFQRYLRPNSKVVVKRTKFWTFFVVPNFYGGGAPKFRTCVNTPTESRVKRQSFVGLHPLTPKL